MADYDSDSSAANDIQTDVVLGYSSREPTIDKFSQLGGHPTWLDEKRAPSGSLAKCRVCNGLMNLLLQLNADLDDEFPGHQRRLYILTCKRKACRRKDGSVRGFRASRRTTAPSTSGTADSIKEEEMTDASLPSRPPLSNLGETLFGVSTQPRSSANPFAVQGTNGVASNPFATTSTSSAAKPAQRPISTMASLPETFAQKAKISGTENLPPKLTTEPTPHEEWPEKPTFPEPYPQYHVDADKEYIDSEPQPTLAGMRVDTSGLEGEGSNSSAAEDKAAFESSMDKTFQKFADRLAQNPEQVLRYEFRGQPLLYSKTDAVGKLLGPTQETSNAKVKTRGAAHGPRIPSCTNCGAGRVFEVQLTPHAITELEVDEMSVDGMDWGTIIMAVCDQNCLEKGKAPGDDVGYVEEWIGVQWEESVGGGGVGQRS